jgi:hypothetical protein
MLAATSIAVVIGPSLVVPGTILDGVWDLNRIAYQGLLPFGRAAGVSFLALGIATSLAGAGLLRGKRWAWWLAVAVFGLNGLGDCANLYISRDAWRSGAGIIIDACFLYCLICGRRSYSR